MMRGRHFFYNQQNQQRKVPSSLPAQKKQKKSPINFSNASPPSSPMPPLLLVLLVLPHLALAVSVCFGNSSSCDLQSLVDRGGLVLLYGPIALSQPVVVSSSVSIMGARDAAVPAVISGSGMVRLFEVAPLANLSLSGLTLRMGFASDGQGGAAVFLDQGANLVADNCSFEQNLASNGGGGAVVKTLNSNLVLTRNTFVYNGAALGDGGALLLQSSVLFMDQCQFLNNAAFYTGGAIKSIQSTVYISNSSFSGNSAQRGGALASDYSPYSLIFSSLFDSNVALFGGAIHDFDNVLAVLSTTLSNNNAQDTSSQAIFLEADGQSASRTLISNSVFFPASNSSSFINTLALPILNCSGNFSTLPVLGCGPGATCLPSAVGVKCNCASAAPTSGNKPYVCASQPYYAAQPPVAQTCLTSGGYVPEGTTCVFPFVVTYGSGKTIQKQVFTECQPVKPGLPYDGILPRNGTAMSYWCATVAKYSPDSPDSGTRKSWGYCGNSCGFVDPIAPTTSSPAISATPSPSSPTTVVTLATIAPSVPVLQTAPELVLARYGGTAGSRIEVYFDRDTNCGGTCSGASILCSTLVQVVSPTDLCSWFSPNTMYIFPSLPYANVTLLPNAIANPSGGPPFSTGYLPVVGGGILLGAPIVTLVAPLNVSRCVKLQLDGSNSDVDTITPRSNCPNGSQ